MKTNVPFAICEHCDAAYTKTPLDPGQKAHCTRCGAILYRHHRYTLDLMLAVTLAAIFVFVIANCYPVATVAISGEHNSARLWGTITATYAEGDWFISLIAAVTIFFAPLLLMMSLAYVLIPLRLLGRKPVQFGTVMRLIQWMRPWSLIEVFMLGALVAIVKVRSEVDVYPGIGIWALGALTILLTLMHGIDPHHLWDISDEAGA